MKRLLSGGMLLFSALAANAHSGHGFEGEGGWHYLLSAEHVFPLILTILLLLVLYKIKKTDRS